MNTAVILLIMALTAAPVLCAGIKIPEYGTLMLSLSMTAIQPMAMQFTMNSAEIKLTAEEMPKTPDYDFRISSAFDARLLRREPTYSSPR